MNKSLSSWLTVCPAACAVLAGEGGVPGGGVPVEQVSLLMVDCVSRCVCSSCWRGQESQVEVYLLNKSLSSWLTVCPAACAVLAGEGGVPGGGVPVEQVSLLMVDCVSRCVCSSCWRGQESQVEVYLLNKSLSSWLTVCPAACAVLAGEGGVPGGGVPVEQVSLLMVDCVSRCVCSSCWRGQESQVEVYLLNKSLSSWLTVCPAACAVLAGEGGVPGGGVPVEQVSLLMVDCVSRCVCSSCWRGQESQVEVYLLNKSLSSWLTVCPAACAVLAGEGGVPGGGVPVEQVSLLMVDCVSRCVCSSCWRGWSPRWRCTC